MGLRALWCAAALVTLEAPAAAYDFEIGARTTGQAYTLVFRDEGRVLQRRRLTQRLSLDVWNILEPPYDPGRPDPPPLAPFDVYVTADLRLDHDFGDFTQGSTIYPLTPTRDVEEAATSAVPELAGGHLALDVLEAHAGARGVLGRIDVALGRQVFVDSLDWYALDGLSAAARLPHHVAVWAHGGFLVRDRSPLAAATREPDGTASSQCTVIADPDDPGSMVDAGCLGRDEPAPTFGVGVGTHGLRRLSARLSYRRSVSPSDDGLTPGLAAASPAWGVLEEKLALTARGNLGDGAVVPWVAGRWNFLLALVDEAHAGVRLARGDHAITPEARWSHPTFAGDSIFNVFSSEPVLDVRLGYDVWPAGGRLRLAARGFWRRYGNSDIEELAPGETIAYPAVSAGGAATVGLRLDARAVARLDVTYEDGQGGLRAGGDLSARVRVHRRALVDGRVTLVRLDDGLDDAATTFGAQAGARLLLGPGMSLHLLAEENVNRHDRSLRLIALLDLSFRPEH
jgi:hypothetical protein